MTSTIKAERISEPPARGDAVSRRCDPPCGPAGLTGGQSEHDDTRHERGAADTEEETPADAEVRRGVVAIVAVAERGRRVCVATQHRPVAEEARAGGGDKRT